MTGSSEYPFGNLVVEGLKAGPDLLSRLIEGRVPLPESDVSGIIQIYIFRFVISKIGLSCVSTVLINHIAIRNRH